MDRDPVLPLALTGYPVTLRLAEPLDDDGLYDLCASNHRFRIERSATGELTIMAPTGGDTGRRNSEINFQLALWARSDGTGVSVDSSGGFLLPNGALRAPDAAWVRRERWASVSTRKFPVLCPDFVIELLSPSDRMGDAHAKLREYVENGARLAWLIDADERVVWVYHPGGAVERHDEPETVSGDPVLPGFLLVVDPIW